jgi:hypothetical protein
MVSAMLFGFAAKAAILLSLGFRRRCSRIVFNRDLSALAIGQNISLRPLAALRSSAAIAARTMESTAHFFCRPAFFADTPGVIR